MDVSTGIRKKNWVSQIKQLLSTVKRIIIMSSSSEEKKTCEPGVCFISFIVNNTHLTYTTHTVIRESTSTDENP